MIIDFLTNDKKWICIKKENSLLYFYGYLYNYTLEELANKIDTVDNKNIKELITSIDGHFALIFISAKYSFIAVDKIRSLPLYYIHNENSVYISDKINPLVEKLAKQKSQINSEQVLCFKMSGYTLFEKTIYKNILSLNAGDLIQFNNKIEQISYYKYEPWRIVNKNYENYLQDLTDTTISIFKKMIKSLNNRQVIIPLSAGNDSRLVASCLKHLGYENVLCYSYGTKGNFESKIAEKIAHTLKYKFLFIPMNHIKEQAYYKSEDFNLFLEYANTSSSIHFFQSISTIKYLKDNKLIDSNAIFINGNSGDFISGGHILDILKIDNSKLSKKEQIDIAIHQIIKKHYSLWGYLNTLENKKTLHKLIFKELKEKNLLELDLNDHGIYEYIEFINRQTKYVITGQRVYEFYGYEWRLPLWDDYYLKFWEKVPKAYKIDQKLYKDMLINNNFGNVWTEKIPVNKYDIVPKWIIPIRTICKIPFIFLGKNKKIYWKNFEISFFQYWTDVIHIADSVGYWSHIKSYFKKPRNAISILVKNYLKAQGIKENEK